MKKLYSLVAACLLVGSMSVKAEDYYPKYFLNEDFTGLEALPTGWSVNTNGKQCILSGNGSAKVADGAILTSGSGGGNRGQDLYFPSIDTTMTSEHPVVFMEFDWYPTKMQLISGKKINTYSMLVSGSGAKVGTTSWYTPAIFGLYIYGSDNAIHYWNMDPWGSEQTDTTVVTPQWGNQYGPVYLGISHVGNTQYNTFQRCGTTNSNPDASTAFIDSINASTKALVYPWSEYTHSIHIKAKLNFKTQMVEALTLTQNDSLANTITIENQPFLAQYMIGEDTTVVAKEDRIVRDLSVLSSMNTRASKLGNGNNSNFSVYFDNFKIYYLKESIGRRDISVKFIDQDGNEAKAAVTYKQQEVGEELIINAEDLVSFSTDTYYYAFDAEATVAANPTATSYKTMPVTTESSEFKLVFKKYQKASGVLTWTGAASNVWNQIDANFIAEGIEGAIGYQKGCAVILPVANSMTPDTIIINETIEMGESDLNINGMYFLGGSSLGKIEGTGKLIVNAPATISTITKLTMVVNGIVNINNAAAASSIEASKDAIMALTMADNFSVPVTGPGAGSKIGFAPTGRNKDQEFSMKVSNVDTVAYALSNTGKLNGVRYEGGILATYPNATDSTPVVIAVANAMEEPAMAGFGAITKTGFQYANVILGDYVRLVREYNEANNEVDYIGALSGDKNSRLESGWVDGRAAYYRIGGLNNELDMFLGDVRSFQKTDTTYSTSVIYLVKEGTGRMDFAGTLAFNGTIEAAAGTLDLSDATFQTSLPMNWTSVPDTAFATVITSLTVDSAATVYLPDTLPINTVQGKTGSIVYSKNTVFPGDVQIGGEWTGAATAWTVGALDAKINLTVESPDNAAFQAIDAEGGIQITRSQLNVTVLEAATTTVDLPILLTGTIDMPEGAEGSSVLVNGNDVIANPGEEGQGGFAFSWETGMLTCYSGPLALSNTNKEISSVECYDILGAKASETTTGIVLRKTTFNDGSVSIEKVINVK